MKYINKRKKSVKSINENLYDAYNKRTRRQSKQHQRDPFYITSKDTDSNDSIQEATTDSTTNKNDYYDLDLAIQSLNEPCPDVRETNGETSTYNFSSSDLSSSIEDETDNEKLENNIETMNQINDREINNNIEESSEDEIPENSRRILKWMSLKAKLNVRF